MVTRMGFIERLDAYFFTNTITGNGAEEKKRAILLTVYGSKTYSLMKNLLAPRKPTEKNVQRISGFDSKSFIQNPW